MDLVCIKSTALLDISVSKLDGWQGKTLIILSLRHNIEVLDCRTCIVYVYIFCNRNVKVLLLLLNLVRPPTSER
jgi:hypothetical protein